MEKIEKYGEIKEFRSTPNLLIVRIGKGFDNNTKNVNKILKDINSITKFRKVDFLEIKKDKFNLILEK